MSCLKMFDPLHEGPAIGIEASVLRKVSEQPQSLSQLSSPGIGIARSNGLGPPLHFGAVSFGSQIQVLLQHAFDTTIADVRRLNRIQDRLDVSCVHNLLR